MIFLLTKFTAGAWVVVLAVPAIMLLFTRIHRYCHRAGAALGLGAMPGRPVTEPTMVVVPVTGVSRLAEHAISEALTISQNVVAIAVLTSGTGQNDDDLRASELREQWARWNSGPPLRVLTTEYAFVAGPVVAFVDQLRQRHSEQIVVLIPAAVPDQLRYRYLHNQLDIVLTNALRDRPDIITARVPVPLHVSAGRAVTGSGADSLSWWAG